MTEVVAVLKACKLTATVIVNMYKGAQAISDIFLTRKIEKFAEKSFSEESKKYIEEMSDEKFEQFLEQIIHTLTHAETVIKAMYVKNLTEAYCNQKINWNTFCRMNFIIGQIYTFDLKSLVLFYNEDTPEIEEDEITQNKLNHFAQLGLLDYTNISDAMGETPMFETNDFGKKFIECALPDLDELSKKRVKEKTDFMMKYL